jgi:hypothetical protein
MSDEVKTKKRISISEDDMTLGDMEDFEEITGKSFSDSMRRVKVIDPDTGMQKPDPDPAAKGKGLWSYEMSMKGLTAIVYISLRKENPSITLDEVRAMKLDELDLAAAEDPTQAEVSEEESAESSA